MLPCRDSATGIETVHVHYEGQLFGIIAPDPHMLLPGVMPQLSNVASSIIMQAKGHTLFVSLCLCLCVGVVKSAPV